MIDDSIDEEPRRAPASARRDDGSAEPFAASFFSPGQTWQMWPSQASTMTANEIRQRTAFNEASVDDFLGPQRRKLVDMIQADFPRTPSPVYANPPPSLARETSSLPKTNTRFTISGSADALLSAATEIEAEKADEASLVFDIKRLGLLSEEDEVETQIVNEVAAPQPSSARWNKTAFPRSVVAGIISSDEDYYAEPFAMSVPMPPSAVAAKPFSPANVASYGRSSAPGFANMVPTTYPLTPADKMSILEDFRANRHKKYELVDLKGFIVEFSTDQHGSRFIQQKLETASDAEKDMVFAEIYPMALQLMTDVFGNYVIQKFFEYGMPDQRVALAHVMHNNVLTLSLQMYGCRVVQKALEHLPLSEQTRLVQELEGHVLRCVKDQNGNHVIQKCIECIPLSTNAPFLAASFLNQATQLAMHPYGCRVIQRIFEHGPVEQTSALLDELLRQPGQLIQDQYGNYVIQHVLERGKADDRARIIKYLQGHVLEYSRHKFASNVVEKCVSFGSEKQRQALIEEVLTPMSISDASESDQSSSSATFIPLHLMMRDQFANYVVQKMLDVVDGEQRDLLLASIKPQLPQLRKYTYGKHILAKVERMLGLTPSDVGFADQVRPHYSAPTTPRPGPRGFGSNTGGGYNQPGGFSGYRHESSRFVDPNSAAGVAATIQYEPPSAPAVIMPTGPRTAPAYSTSFMSAPSSPVILGDPNEFPPLGGNKNRR